MAVHVYILKLSNGKYYTGMSANLPRRMKQHQSGQSKSTKHARPVRLEWTYRCMFRKLARQLEVRIKHTGAKKFIEQQKSNRAVLQVVKS